MASKWIHISHLKTARQPVTYYLLSLSATQQNSYLPDNLAKLPGRGNSLGNSSLMHLGSRGGTCPSSQPQTSGNVSRSIFMPFDHFESVAQLPHLWSPHHRMHFWSARALSLLPGKSSCCSGGALVSAIYRVVTPLPFHVPMLILALAPGRTLFIMVIGLCPIHRDFVYFNFPTFNNHIKIGLGWSGDGAPR